MSFWDFMVAHPGQAWSLYILTVFALLVWNAGRHVSNNKK